MSDLLEVVFQFPLTDELIIVSSYDEQLERQLDQTLMKHHTTQRAKGDVELIHHLAQDVWEALGLDKTHPDKQTPTCFSLTWNPGGREVRPTMTTTETQPQTLETN